MSAETREGRGRVAEGNLYLGCQFAGHHRQSVPTNFQMLTLLFDPFRKFLGIQVPVTSCLRALAKFRRASTIYLA